MKPAHSDDTIAFAEKLLLLLDQGAFTATYKYALLLAIIDLCLEQAATDGRAPDHLTSRQIAEKVLEFYWPHTSLFRGSFVLRQNSKSQAAIISAIRSFREGGGEKATTLVRSRYLDPEGFDRLLEEVEWKLIQMPLPRLQVIGGKEERFIYELDWVGEPSRSEVRSGSLDTTVRFRPGVGEKLVRLSGLIRPLIQRQWARLVARFNRDHVKEYELERFLFGVPREAPRRLVANLRELQGDVCFYCESRFRSGPDVDHFIPWARHPDDGIHNLVLAHGRCNRAKRDFLAATDHVERWDARFAEHDGDLKEIATGLRWAHDADRTRSVARAIYLRLREDARLWVLHGSFAPPDLPRLRDILVGWPPDSEEQRRVAERPPREGD